MLESKRRAIIFLALSILLAAGAGFLFLKKIKDLNAQLGEMVEIYVATTDIASRSLIQPDQITTREIPKKYADDSYITDKAVLKNQVTVVPLSKGNIITKNIIKPATTVRDQNSRLVTVYASGKVVFDQQLDALDRVDIIVSRDINGKPATEVFMKDVPVAMVAKTEDQFRGVALEMPFEQVPVFIHQQHYADVMRILKANVGKGELGIPEPFSEQPAEPGAPGATPAEGQPGNQSPAAPSAPPANAATPPAQTPPEAPPAAPAAGQQPPSQPPASTQPAGTPPTPVPNSGG
ncbi:flagella basal body P-ring formation protein FlgA [Brevibacillus invocatus]|uniref:flagella basal body P-ring formation protein FlgA n=1 Tax=Brevibacillus invocatus TaxID=173959 RepID=UPI002040C89A|nr:flagella basal body P-ring formation protein FlgA [Brevibacillus invocatus]MCM3079826.1 flagella basal body P-ring formation protein FlgA [Brevibacillus invocatus]MCM3430019.1 flagella basal body P-ring formation protein FlgA [Brevibacillus invocatus]